MASKPSEPAQPATSPALAVHFQPVVSLRERSVVGVEALYLPRGPGSISPGSPAEPPRRMADQGEGEVRPGQRRGWAAFREQGGRLGDAWLWVPLAEASGKPGANDPVRLREFVRRLDLSPGRVVAALTEFRPAAAADLPALARECRRLGFLLALDQAAGTLDMTSLAAVAPDLVRLGRVPAGDLPRAQDRREELRAWVELAHRRGARVVAGGVERPEEALAALQAGADLLQGGLFAPPEPRPEAWAEPCRRRLEELAGGLARQAEGRLAREQESLRGYRRVVAHLSAQLAWALPPDFERVLDELIGLHTALACLYVLDEAGRQVTGLVHNPRRPLDRPPAVLPPARPGSDHSLEDCYLRVRHHRRLCVSPPRFSPASGRRCLTLGGPFRDAAREPFILCAEFVLAG